MIKKWLKPIWYSFVKVSPYTVLGYFIPMKLVPRKYLLGLYSDFFIREHSKGLLASIIRQKVIDRYYSGSEEHRREFNRELVWGAAAGKRWHSIKRKLWSNQEGFCSDFLKHKISLIEYIEELLSKYPRFKTICEIGTGNGLFINYLSGKIPGIDNFIGIDLNKDQISENAKIYNSNNLKFIHSEIVDYLNKENPKEILFITSGTLEYFTPGELKELLGLIRDKIEIAAVGLSEPINMDLQNGLISKPRGTTAFSYNYPLLFKECGYHVFRQKLTHIDPGVPFYDCVNMVATTFPLDAP